MVWRALALVVLIQAQNQPPDSAESRYKAALRLQEQSRYAEAEAAYRSFVASRPRSVPGWTNLGVVLSRQGKFREAIEAYRRALDLDPSLAPVRMNLGIAYYQLGDWNNAVRWLEQASQAMPQDRRVRHLLAVSYTQAGNFSEGCALFEKLLPAEDVSVRIGAATACAKAGRSEAAAALFDQVFREGHNQPAVQLMLGLAYLGLGHYAQAETAFSRAVTLDSKLVEGQFYLGGALFKQSKFDAAIAQWRKAALLDPRHFPSVFALGALLAEQLQDGEAEKWLLAALALRPEHAGVHHELGKLYLRQTKYQAALEHLTKAAGLIPQSKEIAFLRASVLQRLGRRLEAAQELERGKRLYQQERAIERDLFDRALEGKQ